MPDDELDLATQLAEARARENDLRTKEHLGEDWYVGDMIEVNRRIRGLQAAMGLELDRVYEPPLPPAPPVPSSGPGIRPESQLLEGLRHSFSEPVPEPAPPVATPAPAPDDVPAWKRPVIYVGVAVTVLIIGAAFSILGSGDDDETSATADAPPTTAAPTTTTTVQASAPAAPAAAPVAPAARLESVLSPPSTLYTIHVGDDPDAYDYDWSATDVSCGAFVVGSGGRAQWDHPTGDGGCTHVAPDHPGTIVVRATRSDGASFTCTYTGGSTAGSADCAGS